ncbi:hypothetical protein Tco_0650422 [Tanacetum coccineum]
MVYVPQWNVTNGFRLDDGGVCREMVDEFAPPKFFASIRGMEHDQLFTEFNVGAGRQISLSAEVRMRAEYNIREKRRLKSVVDEQAEPLKDEVKTLKEHNATLEKEKTDLGVKVADLAASVKVREQEVADLDAQVTSVKSQSDNLVDRVHELETSSAGLQEKVTAYENCIDQLEKFQDDKMKEVLSSPSYHHFGAAIGKAIEKGIHDGLSAGITHGKEGRVLTDVAAYNPSAKADYVSALQQLQHVNFSLLAELRSNKDASVEVLMNILRLEDVLTEKLGLSELQPHVDQMVAIHHSPDKTIIGATALSLALDPLSAVALEGTEGTFVTAPDTTTALSTTFVSASSIPPISTDDYEVVHADGQEGAGADADPFPNVDDAESNIS